jgi:hypothetical protein
MSEPERKKMSGSTSSARKRFSLTDTVNCFCHRSRSTSRTSLTPPVDDGIESNRSSSMNDIFIKPIRERSASIDTQVPRTTVVARKVPSVSPVNDRKYEMKVNTTRLKKRKNRKSTSASNSTPKIKRMESLHILLFILSDIAVNTALECLSRSITVTLAFNKKTDLESLFENANVVYFDWNEESIGKLLVNGIDLVLITPDTPNMIFPYEIIVESIKNSGVKGIVKCNYGSLPTVKLTELGSRVSRLEQQIMESGKNWIVVRYSISPDEFLNIFKEELAADGVIHGPNFNCTWPALEDIVSFLVAIFMEPDNFMDKEWILTGKNIVSTEDLFNQLKLYIGKEIFWESVKDTNNELFNLLIECSEADIPTGIFEEILHREPLLLSQWCKKNAEKFS